MSVLFHLGTVCTCPRGTLTALGAEYNLFGAGATRRSRFSRLRRRLLGSLARSRRLLKAAKSAISRAKGKVSKKDLVTEPDLRLERFDWDIYKALIVKKFKYKER